MGVIRPASDFPMGIAGRRGKFAAVSADADVPALSRKGASESLEGKLGFLAIAHTREAGCAGADECECDKPLRSERRLC